MGRTICRTFLLTLAIAAFSTAHAQLDNPNTFSFDGLLLDDSNGNPMSGPVALKIQVYNPAANCLLFEEDHASVALDAAGGFSVRVGTGTRNTGADGGLAWKSIFANKGTLIRASNGGTCGTSYTPATGDSRKIRVTVNSVNVLTPDFTMATVPFATTADTLQGLTPSDLVLASGGSAVNGFVKMNNQAAVRFADSGGTNYVDMRAPATLPGVLNFVLPATVGSVGNILATDGAGNLSWTNTVANATFANNAGQIQGFSISSTPPSANQVLTWNGSTWLPMTVAGSGGGSGTVTAVSAGAGLLGGPITTSGSLAVNVGTGANQIVQLNGSAQLPAVDGSFLTNVNAIRLQTRDVSPAAPSPNQFLGWNGTMWMPMTIAGTGGGTGNFMADGTVAMTGNFRLGGNWLSADGGNEGLVVDANGRVGIGTNIPNGGAALDIYGLGSGASSFLVPRDTTGSRPGGVDGMIRYNTTLAKFEVFENGTWVNMVAAGGGSQWTTAGPDIYFNSGAVGIGTSTPNPGAALDVMGSGTLSSMIVPRGTTAQRPLGVNGMIRYNTNVSKFETYENGQWVGFGPGFPLLAPGGGAAAAPTYSFSTSTNTGMYSPSAGTLSFSTAGTERLSLNNSGNVGIGTPAPVAPLQVHSGSNPYPLVMSNTSGGSVGMAFRRTATDRAYIDVDGTNGTFMVDAGADSFVDFVISNTGRVGFGTTNPAVGAIADFSSTGSGTSSILVPRDTLANRPTGVNGMIRYNTSTAKFEAYESGWKDLLRPPPPAHGMELYTSSGPFNVPPGVTSVKVVVIGGAGGGSGATGTGGAGGSGQAWVNGLTPGETITITVGAGGNNTTPTAGTNSSFGTFVVGTGGGEGNNSQGTPGSFTTAPSGGVTVSSAQIPGYPDLFKAGRGMMMQNGESGVVFIEW